jgi:flagellar assembly factor FliW
MTTMAASVRVHFVEPLAGFPGEYEFALNPIDEQGLLHSLRSTTTPALRFVLGSAPAFFPAYAKQITAAVSAALAGAEVDLLLVVAIGDGLADATVNLRAPIALVRENDHAVQVILDDESLPMRQRLLDGTPFGPDPDSSM